MAMVTLTIDGVKVEAEDRIPLIEVARSIGIDIPTLCYFKGMEPYGVCRVCLCEVKIGKRTRMVTGCNYPVSNGIQVFTKSDRVIKNRKMNIELLLSRCPNVDVVRKLASEYGVDKVRFEMADETCIMCGLCARMCSDVVGANIISFESRGPDRKVTLPFDEEMPEKCISCGACAFVCPTGHITLEDTDGYKIRHSELMLGPKTPIYIPTMQAVPNKPVIDTLNCIHFKTGNCKLCETVCEADAINYEMEEEIVEREVGNIIVATGYEPFDPTKTPQYGYGKLPNVITGPEFEKMTNASGPTGGKILMANGKEPESIAILHCIGSRDKHFNSYCSRVCCMYSLKFAHLVKEKSHSKVYQFYIDMRSFGKGYEEFYERVQNEGSNIIRGKVAEITTFAESKDEEGKLIALCEDTLAGMQRRIPVDMVVLSVGLEARKTSPEIARLFNISRGADGFFIEKHPKLDPVATATDGVFVAGCCQGPKDIPDSVAQGAAAAARVLSLISKGKVEIEAITSYSKEEICTGCRICLDLCPFSAIDFNAEKKISVVNEALCKGCGTCVAACPSGAMIGRHFTNKQIAAQIEGILEE